MVKDNDAVTTTTSSQPMRGRGEVSRHKNAKKKQLMAEKATREAKQLADAKLQPFSMYKATPVPSSLRRPWPANPRYIVVKRTNAVPGKWNQLLMLWSLVHLGPHMGYVASEEEIEAAKGINIMDFFLRCSVVPIAAFETEKQVEEFLPVAAELLNASVLQVLLVYAENPVPCQSNGTNRTYVDRELSEFMKNYNREQRANYDLQKKRILDLPAIFQEAGRNVTVSDPVDAATLAENDPSRIKSIDGVTPEAARDAVARGDREEELVISPGDADIILGGDPRTEMIVRELISIDGRIALYEKQIVATRQLIDELHLKKEQARRDLADIKGNYDACSSDDDSGSDGSDCDDTDAGMAELLSGEAVSPSQPLITPVRRLGTAPDGSRFKVTMDGKVEPFADGESDASFSVLPPDLVEPPLVTDPELRAAQATTSALFGNRVRALETADDDPNAPSAAKSIAFGVGSEAQTERITDLFAEVHAHNARNRIRIANELRAEAEEAAAAATTTTTTTTL